MKIRIKVKTLIKLTIITLLVVFIVLPYGTLGVAKYLDKKGSNKAITFYESYLNKPLKLQNDEALYNYALSLAGETDKYTIMMMGWGGPGVDSTVEGLEKAKLSLMKILENSTPESKYFSKSYSKLMDIFISLQEPDELLNWIQWGKKSTHNEINYISDLYGAFYYYANREYDLTEEVLEAYDITDEVVDRRYYIIKGEIALFKGDFDSAKRYFELSNSFNSNRDFEYVDSLYGSRSYIGRNYWYDEYESGLKGDYKVRGKVEFNGKPMPFVEVYIQEGTGFRTGGNDHVAITDINGEYETLGIRPGTYQIGIGISNSQLYDKVYLRKNLRNLDLYSDMVFDYSFSSPIKIISPKPGTVIDEDNFIVEWDEVSGADYYIVELTTIKRNEKGIASTFKTPIIDENGNYRIKGINASFDISSVRNNIGGLMFDGEEMLLQPMGILGNILPGEEHPIIVNAYDENDNLIGSSLPLNTLYENIPSIKVEGILSEGEVLISQSKYEEAILHYENILQKDPNNEEALVYLSKIYMIGWKKGQENYNKALEYSIRYKDISKDYDLALKTVDFMDNEARIDNQDIIMDLINEVPDNKRTLDYYFTLGSFHLSLGQYEKSRDAYMSYVTDSTYIPDTLIYLNLYLEDFDSALNLISDRRFNPSRASKSKLINSIEGLKENNFDVNEYEIFKSFHEKVLKERLEPEEGNELFNSIYNKISNLNIKRILNEIRFELYWDREY